MPARTFERTTIGCPCAVPQVAALTLQAMEGNLPFQDALARRLDMLRPSRAHIDALLAHKPAVLTDGIHEVMDELRGRHGKEVFLVSGGFVNMIAPIAERLGVPVETHLFANRILFKNDAQGTCVRAYALAYGAAPARSARCCRSCVVFALSFAISL
jgi:phosphoserine phosphatase